MLIDLKLFCDHVSLFVSLLLLTYLLNTTINALIFKALRQRTEEALIGGAMLSQIGEFSFVLISMGYVSEILSATMFISIVLH